MKSFRPSSSVASTALIALVLSFAPPSVHAQTLPGSGSGSGSSSSSSTPFLNSSTNLRSIRSQTTSFDSSTGAPSQPYNGNPGCNQTVMQSMQDSANFSASQNVAVHVNTLQMPASFSSCLTSLLSTSQTTNNAFLQPGNINISAIFTAALDKTVASMLTTLETKACAAAKSALKSASGTIGAVQLDFSKLSSGGAIMMAAPGSSSGTGFVSSGGVSVIP